MFCALLTYTLINADYKNPILKYVTKGIVVLLSVFLERANWLVIEIYMNIMRINSLKTQLLNAFTCKEL